MTLEQAGIVLGIVVSAGSILGMVYLSAIKIARIELKVNTIWEFLMQRAIGEAVQKGLADLNSPLMLTPGGRSLYSDKWIGDLQKFYRSQKFKNDYDLALAIERQFGHEMVKDICIPNGLDKGACLVAAVEAAKQEFGG